MLCQKGKGVKLEDSKGTLNGGRKEKAVKVSSHGQRKQSIHEIQHLGKAKNLTLSWITMVNFRSEEM